MTEAEIQPEIASQSPDVHILSHNETTVYLLGTAHVSKKSADLAEALIREVAPDTVCVELCAPRFDAIQRPDRWADMDIVKVIREKKTFLLLSNLLLAAFQKRIADKMEIRPGEEMLRAIRTAEEVEAEIGLSDREIRITLARVWRRMGLWAKIKLMFQLLVATVDTDDIEEEDIENLKNQDALASLLTELGGAHPVLREVLIDERDRYLSSRIRQAGGEKVVAVVGAGHVPGIKQYWETAIDTEALDALPPSGKTGTVLKYFLPALILLVFVAGFFSGGRDAGADMAKYWILANGLFAGIGAIIALGHPLTIVSAVVAAPITSINPAVAAGWVSGLVEAGLRKPQVRDLQDLMEDIGSARGIWKNKVTRILLVVVLTNVGSMIGTFVALPLMFRLLGKG